MKEKIAITLFFALGGFFTYGQKFEPTIESLKQYECPEWFRDAKFGIYCHWNAQASSKSNNSEWYAREMYKEGSPAYKDHLKNWGHPSKVGYKDVIKAWEADKFNAEEWVSLFKNAGAKYIFTVAVHHDNFDMWNSKYQPRWNSTKWGPKVDVCGEIKRETLKAGLRWGCTTHTERAYSWVQTNKGADTTGPMAGVPYDGNDKEYQDLYLEYPDFSKLGNDKDQYQSPLHSPESWKEHWKNRMFDLIDNYSPDFLYFDGALPFLDNGGKSGMEVVSHYYNHNASMHGGKNEGVMVIKNIENHGWYYPDITSVVLERTYSKEISEKPMVSEESIGPWFYRVNARYNLSSADIINKIIDAVSKNNNFLLNVPPKGDGSFDEEAVKILNGIGKWFAVNGDAIYGTRPWKSYGEGKTRFTTKGNTMNVFVRDLTGKDLLLASMKDWKKSDILKIKLLGSEEKIVFKQTREGLKITLPEKTEPSASHVFQISCKNLPALPCNIVN
jgi:alpha-L-fucosidase